MISFVTMHLSVVCSHRAYLSSSVRPLGCTLSSQRRSRLHSKQCRREHAALRTSVATDADMPSLSLGRWQRFSQTACFYSRPAKLKLVGAMLTRHGDSECRRKVMGYDARLSRFPFKWLRGGF